MSSNIHESAIVSPEARIGENVTIGPYCIIGPNVVIGDGCNLHSHSVFDGHVIVGKNNEFYPFCSIGAPPQDLTYKSEDTKVEIGDNNIFREYISVHRGTMKDSAVTRIGNDNLLMAYVHFGHDVQLGNNCVIVNAVNFAGHVKIGDRVIIGGATSISQFVTLGRGAYIGGASAIDRDIPTFCTALGNRIRLKGINIIGMRRQGISKSVISETVDFLRLMESSNFSPRTFVDGPEAKEFEKNEIVTEIMKMVRESEIGIAPFVS